MLWFTLGWMATALLHGLVVIVISVRVVMRRPPPGVALAWLLFVAAVPAVGVAAYFLLGERRVNLRRAQRVAAMRPHIRRIAEEVIAQGLTNVDWSRHPPAASRLDALVFNTTGNPTAAGSTLTLVTDTQDILQAIAQDIDDAESSVLMEFFIWHEGGTADVVFDAVMRAAARGVVCRVLVDAVGGRPWWNSAQPERLRQAGAEVLPALPVGIRHTLVGRADLRLHRKIVAVDGKVAWTGSMNLVDPRHFKQDAGVGQWIDAMVRVQGAAVSALTATLIADWQFETGEPVDALAQAVGLELVAPQGHADVQTIASGPGETGDALLLIVLAVIEAARDELVLTTPYFVPDEAILRALRAAAARGVRVVVIVPEALDIFLVHQASMSYFEDLMEMGVEIHRYRGGLLHTKAITVDSRMAMFGTANFDMRSWWLNYEVTLMVYDRSFARDLRSLLDTYLKSCVRIDAELWAERSYGQRLLSNAVRLISPVL